MNSTRYYTASKIFTGKEWLHDFVIGVSGSRIQSLFPRSEAGDRPLIEFPGSTIAPAFIDLQIYGAQGKLVAVYPEMESLVALVSHCREGGTAYCLPTVATNSKEVFLKSIDAVKAYLDQEREGILGLHIEGPWLNPLKRGAHIESLIHSPSVQEVRKLLEHGEGVIKMITLAPEVCNDEVIDLILSRGIILSAGHSNATYEQGKKAFGKGMQAATHLFNAMSPLHHREPGLPAAIMNDEKVMASIIPDGHHVDFEMIRLAKSVMRERLFAITDAVTETDQGYYPHQLAGDKYESSGILSGSALTMTKAMKNLVQKVGIEPGEAIRMCSLYPARLIGREQELGMIGPGYICKFVVLDEDLDLRETLF